MDYRKLLRMIATCEEISLVRVMAGYVWEAYEEDRITPEEYANLKIVCGLMRKSFEN